MEYKCSQLRLPRVGEVPAAVMVGERIPAKASQRPASFGTQQCAPHARPSVCTAGSLLQFCRRPSNEQNLPNYEPWQCETVKKSHDTALDLKGEPGHEPIVRDAVLRSETTGGHFWMTLTAGGHRDQTTGKDVKWGSWSLV